MARQCVILQLGENTYKLRLTLKGQKALMARDPGTPALTCVMGAIDDADDLAAVLTEALSWEGNENEIHSGEELYDELVDAGYAGSEAFMGLVFDIAHNAGLISGDEHSKLKQATGAMLRRNIDRLVASMEDSYEEPPVPDTVQEDDTAPDPLADLKTLDG